jgi:hypothetical protein
VFERETVVGFFDGVSNGAGNLMEDRKDDRSDFISIFKRFAADFTGGLHVGDYTDVATASSPPQAVIGGPKERKRRLRGLFRLVLLDLLQTLLQRRHEVDHLGALFVLFPFAVGFLGDDHLFLGGFAVDQL